MGRVVDSDGRPVAGAQVCVVVGGNPTMCDETAADGSYALPGRDQPAVRIVATGFLPRTIAAVAQASPVVLERAAALRLRGVDRATGKGTAGEADLVYSTGRKLGPFPLNEAGLAIPTLPPGDARVVVRAAGYREATSEVVRLASGRSAEIVVQLDREAEPAKKK